MVFLIYMYNCNPPVHPCGVVYQRACGDIKTEKAQKQDWNGILATKLN